MPQVDADAFASVLKAVAPRMRGLFARYHIPRHDEEDLVQEAIAAALVHWDKIDQKERWILVTTRNLCAAYHRKRKCWGRLVQSVDPEQLQALAVPLSPPQEDSERTLDVMRLWRTLDPVYQRLLYFRYFEELGPTEVASRVGCHPANVRKAVLRVLTQLKFLAHNKAVREPQPF